MGRQKKKTAHQRRLDSQRKLRARTNTAGASGPGSDQEVLDMLARLGALSEDATHDDVPPPEAVAAYAEVFEWAAQNLEKAADLACFDDSDWVGVLAGIAFSERFGFPDEQVRQRAWQFRAWHILNGMKYTLDWPEPVACMTEDEIIAQLRRDGAAGKISLAP